MALQKEQVKFSEIPIFATEVQWVLLVSFTMLKDKKLDSKQFWELFAFKEKLKEMQTGSTTIRHRVAALQGFIEGNCFDYRGHTNA